MYSVCAFQEKKLEYIIGEFAFAKQARAVRFFFVFLFVCTLPPLFSISFAFPA